MTLSLQEISDRMEIQDLLAQYSHAVDSGSFDLLDDVFTPDAYIDYTALGGAAGDLASTKAFLAAALAAFRGMQHMISNHQIRVEGDRGWGRIMCFNPMQLNDGKTDPVMFFGLWYIDEYQRTPDGWRISRRAEEKSYQFNVPGGVNAGP